LLIYLDPVWGANGHALFTVPALIWDKIQWVQDHTGCMTVGKQCSWRCNAAGNLERPVVRKVSSWLP